MRLSKGGPRAAAGACGLAFLVAGPSAVAAPVLDSGAHEFHLLLVGVFAAIAAILYGAMAWATFTRRLTGPSSELSTHSSRFEVLWTLIPAIILFGSAVPAIQTLLEMGSTEASELTTQMAEPEEVVLPDRVPAETRVRLSGH